MEQVREIRSKMSNTSFEEILNKIAGGDINDVSMRELIAALIFKHDGIDNHLKGIKADLAEHEANTRKTGERVEKIEKLIEAKSSEIKGAQFIVNRGWKIVIAFAVIMGVLGVIMEDEVKEVILFLLRFK